jgi:hypothetical protein
MNRREFMGVAGAAAVLPMASAGGGGVVLFDARYGCSRDFAARSAFAALATNQDVVRLWFENASFRRARQVAGLTPHSDFEIVQRLLKGKSLLSAEAVRATDRPAALVSWHFA